MYKRYYDEPEPFEIDEDAARKELECAYYHPELRIEDIKAGHIVRTVAAVYAATAEQLSDEALTVTNFGG